jgi:putative transposase
MKRKRFAETQILELLKQYEGGRDAGDVSREAYISKATLFNWRMKYSGMESSQIKEMKNLKEGNWRLKQMYPALSLNHQLANVIIKKKR